MIVQEQLEVDVYPLDVQLMYQEIKLLEYLVKEEQYQEVKL